MHQIKRKKKVNPGGFGFQGKKKEQKLVMSFFVNHRKWRKGILRTICLTSFYTKISFKLPQIKIQLHKRF